MEAECDIEEMRNLIFNALDNPEQVAAFCAYLRGDYSREMQIEFLAMWSDYEVKFPKRRTVGVKELITLMRKLAISDDRDVAFFAAYALAIGDMQEGKFLLAMDCKHPEFVKKAIEIVVMV